eukprot:gene1567-1712_t
MTSKEERAQASMKQIIDLVLDCRYLAAHELYAQLLSDLKSTEDTTTATTSAPDDEATIISYQQFLQNLLKENDVIIQKLLTRYQEVMETLHYQDSDQPWIEGAHLFGVTTSYQYDTSDHSLIIKLEGVMEELPIFEQCAVIHEVDLFPTWLPFCKEGVTVDKVGIAELIPYVYICVPPLGRDFVMNAYGADCLTEHGKLLIIGKSIDNYPEKEVPFRTPGWFHDRMEVKQFRAITEVLTPTSAKTVIVADVNPRCPLPQALLNFVIKNLAGVVLYFFRKQVMKVHKDHSCEHAHRIRENKEFYSGWVLPKLRAFCTLRGWPQPVVLSLGEDGLPPKDIDSEVELQKEAQVENSASSNESHG